MSLVPSSSSNLFETTMGLAGRFRKPIAMDACVRGCLERINFLVDVRIPGATVDVVGEGPDGRIDLVARYRGVALGRSFILHSECEVAHTANPGVCDAIDPVAMCWLTVLNYRAKEIRRFQEKQLATA